MIVLACDTCCTVIRVQDDPDVVLRLLVQHPVWKTRERTCVRCPSTLRLVEGVEKDRILDAVQLGALPSIILTATEAFRAMCGLGLPDEIGHAKETVEALLLSGKIVKVHLRMVESGRVILDALDLENNLRIYLASSPHGASILKITRRTDERMDNDLSHVLAAAEEFRLQGRRQSRPGGEGGGGGEGDGEERLPGGGDADGGSHQASARHPERGAGAPQGNDDPANPGDEMAGGGAEGVRAE